MGKQGSFLKRFTDIIISLIILIIFLPLIIIISIAIKLDSNGPVFFVQDRSGLKGQPFRMIKFRGMVQNALAIGPDLTQVNDPRITKVGKILRRTSLDEIPQFFNVLKGEMSIIGPRPEIVRITNEYNDYQKQVFNFKPGITGISQINGRQMLTPVQRTKMEIEFYDRETFFEDLKIIYKTIQVIVTNQGNL